MASAFTPPRTIPTPKGDLRYVGVTPPKYPQYGGPRILRGKRKPQPTLYSYELYRAVSCPVTADVSPKGKASITHVTRLGYTVTFTEAELRKKVG